MVGSGWLAGLIYEDVYMIMLVLLTKSRADALDSVKCCEYLAQELHICSKGAPSPC